MSHKIIQPAYVIDVNDPLLLNRVRVKFRVQIDDKNNDSILNGVPNKYKSSYSYGRVDLSPE